MHISLSDSSMRTGVPYRPAERAESKNWGYFDLKREPSLISEIRELEGVPELRELIKSINAPEGFFRTIGCEKADGQREDDTYWRNCYVEIVFEALDLNRNRENFRMLFENFREYCSVAEGLPDEGTVEFEIGHVVFNDHKDPDDPGKRATGRAAVVWIYGHGRTPEEARSNWGAAVGVVKRFLERVSEGNLPHLQGQVKVSAAAGGAGG